MKVNSILCLRKYLGFAVLLWMHEKSTAFVVVVPHNNNVSRRQSFLWTKNEESIPTARINNSNKFFVFTAANGEQVPNNVTDILKKPSTVKSNDNKSYSSSPSDDDEDDGDNIENDADYDDFVYHDPVSHPAGLMWKREDDDDRDYDELTSRRKRKKRVLVLCTGTYVGRRPTLSSNG